MLIVKILGVFILGVFFSNAMATVTPDTCNHTYALCIAAKCTKIGSGGGITSCSCKVFEGTSYAYGGLSCKNLKPHDDVVYSTYSTELSANGIMTCPNLKVWADCMGAFCTRKGTSDATCYCKVKSGTPPKLQGTLGGNCNSQKNCSSDFIWSMAQTGLLEKGGSSQCPAK